MARIKDVERAISSDDDVLDVSVNGNKGRARRRSTNWPNCCVLHRVSNRKNYPSASTKKETLREISNKDGFRLLKKDGLELMKDKFRKKTEPA